MAWFIKKVTVTREKVRLDLEEHSHYRVVSRQRRSFNRRHFERMLMDADIVVPWKAVNR